MSLFRRALSAAAVLALGLAGAVALASPASAVDRVVTKTVDDNTAGTLRYEVENAGVFDTIRFDPAVFNESTPQTITLDGAAYGDITISTSLNILGPGRDILTVTRGDDPTSYNIFNVVPAPSTSGIDIELSGMTIDAGTTLAQGSAFQSLSGDTDFLTFTDVVFRDQVAQHGAGVNIESATGDVSFYDCEFRDNAVTSNGGGLATLGVVGSILFDNTLFHGNVADDGVGGGIAINPVEDYDGPTAGNVTIQNGSRFESNYGQNAGGGAWINGANDVTVADSSFAENTTEGYAGALYVSATEGILSVTGSTFSENTGGHGGAMRFEDVGTVDIASSGFVGNVATDSGGALGLGMTQGYGAVTITESTFLENRAEDGYGGAIFTDGAVDHTFTISRTTFDSNSANSGDEDGALGGAIYVNEVDEPFTIDSSTFTGNASNGLGTSVAVGDISAGEDALFFIINSTSDEGLDDDEGDTNIYVDSVSGTFSVKYSTIVGFVPITIGTIEPNSSRTMASTILQSAPGAEDIDSIDSYIVAEYSIFSKALTLAISDGPGNQFSTDALLGPLQNNGGPTDTRMPASNSPALSKGGPTLGAPLYDQRFEGFPRIVGALDVGAVEIPAVLPATGGAVPIWMPIVGAAVLLLGAGALLFSMIVRRRAS